MNARLSTLPAINRLPVGNLEDYLQAVNSVPMLSAAEERELAETYRREGDLNAAWRLVLAHLRFVAHVSRGYSGYGLPQSDLIQEGNLGLMKAVKRFDPAVGVRLVSFAVHWIRAEIHEFILRNWRIVRVATTKAQRKLFFNLRGAKQRLGWLNREEVDTVARELGVNPDTVLEMEQRLHAYDAAFDGEAADEDTDWVAPAGYLQDLRFEPGARTEEDDWRVHMESRLADALAGLDARAREIVTRRWLNDTKATLQELANKYGVSAERIRQLENQALKKMRRALASA